jgi:hypothetical protein
MKPNKNMKVFYLALGIIGLLALFAAVGFLTSSSHQNDSELLKKQQADFVKTATADPILKYLPHGDLDYNIVGTFEIIHGQRKLVIVITPILSGADYRQGSSVVQSTIKQRDQEAVEFIKSKGFDPAIYTVRYIDPTH